MAVKWNPEIERAISAAVLNGTPTERIYQGIRAGTLDRLSAAYPLPRRTFFDKLASVRKRLASNGPQAEAPGFLERLRQTGERIKALAAEGDSPEEILELCPESNAISITSWLADTPYAIAGGPVHQQYTSQEFRRLQEREHELRGTDG